MLARLNVIRDQNLGPAEQGISRAAKNLDDSAQKARGRSARRPRSGGGEANRPREGPISQGCEASEHRRRTRRSQAGRPKAKKGRESTERVRSRTRRASERAVEELATERQRHRQSKAKSTRPEVEQAVNESAKSAVGVGQVIVGAGRSRSRRIRQGERRACGCAFAIERAGETRPRLGEGRAGRGQDESEGDCRRAAEDARRAERVRDVPGGGQGRSGTAQAARAGHEADRRERPTSRR